MCVTDDLIEHVAAIRPCVVAVRAVCVTDVERHQVELHRRHRDGATRAAYPGHTACAARSACAICTALSTHTVPAACAARCAVLLSTYGLAAASGQKEDCPRCEDQRSLRGESAVVPAINQVELSPFLGQAELRAFCAKHRILVQAYSPLTQGVKLGHKDIVSAATKAGRTPAQVMLRWAVQHGLIVLPKSVTPARIAENGAIFDFALDADTMRTLDGLDVGFRASWDPTDVP
ncbi:aldo/keto reductase [Sorangium sp. So ce302]|uniref:aldo/keto reductase n=1 Tax=Sorangium sp. So ce302 TaxID=3133297 RepID=UPI003F62F2DF